jgi:hypothetical protein
MMHLYPEPSLRVGDRVRRSCRIERRTGERVESSELLWFDMIPDHPSPDDNDAESYLLATILLSMKEGRTLVVHGAVTHELASNLTEYRDIWSSCLAHLYQEVDFEITRVVEGAVARREAICAFSGGVDSTFSLWSHAGRNNGYRSQTVTYGVMVHGLDILLAEERAFARAFARAAGTLRSMGIPLLQVRTNLRDLVPVNWEHLSGPALVASLGCYKGLAGVAIIGAGQTYGSFLVPWGTNALMDPLLTSGWFQVLHDGAARSRSQKLSAIAEWEEGFNSLRVCWEGPTTDRNCGQCEKCLRTLLNLKLEGLRLPDSFPEVDDLSPGIRKLRLTSPMVHAEWSDLFAAANRRRIREPWVRAVRLLLVRRAFRGLGPQMLNTILPPGSVRRRRAKALLTLGRG